MMRYRVVCKTCDVLRGTYRFKDDATGRALGHQEAETARTFIFDPLNPAHACRIEYYMLVNGKPEWRDTETGTRHDHTRRD